MPTDELGLATETSSETLKPEYITSHAWQRRALAAEQRSKKLEIVLRRIRSWNHPYWNMEIDYALAEDAPERR